MNVTPNSFSDGCQLQTLEAFEARLHQFGSIECIDVGAESTAPINSPISAEEEWSRLSPFIPTLLNLKPHLSIDTYHAETILNWVKLWKDHKLNTSLVWNDVSGIWDEHVEEFLKQGPQFHYVFCHNLAPSRELSGKHMDYVSKSTEGDFLRELAAFLQQGSHPRVILDPCLGFSKTYEQNWYVLEHFSRLQDMLPHGRWLLGFSRKSFLRKRYNLTLDDREILDQKHLEVLRILMGQARGELWIRTHRPELINF